MDLADLIKDGIPHDMEINELASLFREHKLIVKDMEVLNRAVYNIGDTAASEGKTFEKDYGEEIIITFEPLELTTDMVSATSTSGVISYRMRINDYVDTLENSYIVVESIEVNGQKIYSGDDRDASEDKTFYEERGEDIVVTFKPIECKIECDGE
ncbi:hypothetical protein IWW36_001450 [Coemansia brasiliensis]|uniref:Uncharacterized protein n=1 Tax=Coemansia brasiliensis TaxID=2650707 RepID=A0A9W8M204_9FUNG|nr:hypothetical protein IWW36_001450 [Coemansia brasiliensis]